MRVAFVLDLEAPDPERVYPESNIGDEDDPLAYASVHLKLASSRPPRNGEGLLLAAPALASSGAEREFRFCEARALPLLPPEIEAISVGPTGAGGANGFMALCRLPLESVEDMIAVWGYLVLGYERFQNRIRYEEARAEVIRLLHADKEYLEAEENQ